MGRQLSADDIERFLPELLRGANVVAVVPATQLRGWAAEMAWRVARAAAATGRRTALVDCGVDAPTLHSVAGADNAAGIQDVFEYGASLNRIVQAQPEANLYFIAAGTFAPDPQPLVEHPRWRRLSAGFRHEEALLLLYVPAELVHGLAAEPDGMIVLAPQGFDTAAADAPMVADAVARGLPLLAVVAEDAGPFGEQQPAAEAVLPAAVEEPAPAAVAVPPAPVATAPRIVTEDAPAIAPAVVRRSVIRDRPSRPFAMLIEEKPRRRRRTVALAAVALVAGLATLAWWQRARLQPLLRSTSSEPAATAAVALPDTARPLPALPPVESLPWAAQVEAWNRLDDALASADLLEARGVGTMVAPLRLAGRGTVFRVFVGPFPRRSDADSALAALQASGAVARGSGAVADVPLSVLVAEGLTRESAEAERLRLRALGIPVFLLGAGDGTFRLAAGAYDAATQAALVQDLLTPTGSAGTLVPRVGYVP